MPSPSMAPFKKFYKLWIKILPAEKMNHIKKQLVLNKGSEKFIFRYDDGNEGQLLDAFVASASNPQTSFDWFDAAVLSFKLTQSLIGEADQILYKDLNDPVKTYHQGS